MTSRLTRANRTPRMNSSSIYTVKASSISPTIAQKMFKNGSPSVSYCVHRQSDDRNRRTTSNYPNHACEPALIHPCRLGGMHVHHLGSAKRLRRMTQSGPSILCIHKCRGLSADSRPGLRAVQPTFDNLAQPPQPLHEELVIGTKYQTSSIRSSSTIWT